MLITFREHVLEDKASMASSVEIRSPFLDWQFFQYGLALPSELKIMNGYNKSILRDTFRNLLPNQIMDNKTKQGLPISKFRKTSDMSNKINEILNQKNFLENNTWDGKKIKEDFSNPEKRNLKINTIWSIVRTYLMMQGFKKRKENINIDSSDLNESFNYLN